MKAVFLLRFDPNRDSEAIDAFESRSNLYEDDYGEVGGVRCFYLEKDICCKPSIGDTIALSNLFRFTVTSVMFDYNLNETFSELSIDCIIDIDRYNRWSSLGCSDV